MKGIKAILANKDKPDFTHDDLNALTSIAQVHLLAGLLKVHIDSGQGAANVLNDLMGKLPQIKR
jgi:hypothetical protein